MLHGLFPSGHFALVEYFMDRSTKDLSKSLPELFVTRGIDKSVDEMCPETLHQLTSERIRLGVETRLRSLIPYIRTWPQVHVYFIFNSILI